MGVAAAGGLRLRMAMAVIVGVVMLGVLSVPVRVVVAGVIVTRMIVSGVIVVAAGRGVILPRLAPRVPGAGAAGVFLFGGQGLQGFDW